MTISIRTSILVGISLVMRCSVNERYVWGAPISWGMPTSVSDENDIDLSGTLLHAGSWGTDGEGSHTFVLESETIVFAHRSVGSTDGSAGVPAAVGSKIPTILSPPV